MLGGPASEDLFAVAGAQRLGGDRGGEEGGGGGQVGPMEWGAGARTGRGVQSSQKEDPFADLLG